MAVVEADFWIDVVILGLGTGHGGGTGVPPGGPVGINLGDGTGVCPGGGAGVVLGGALESLVEHFLLMWWF